MEKSKELTIFLRVWEARKKNQDVMTNRHRNGTREYSVLLLNKSEHFITLG